MGTLKVMEHTFCLLCCRAHSKLEVSVQPPQMKWTKELNEANNLTLPLLISKQLARFYLWTECEIRGQTIIVGRYRRGGVFFFCFRPKKGGTLRSQ